MKKKAIRLFTVFFTICMFFNVNVCFAEADVMELLSSRSIETTIDRNDDKVINILDVIDAKAKKDKTSEAVLTDYCFNKNISKEIINADDVVLKEILRFNLIDYKDEVLNYSEIDNSKIVSLYNPEKLLLKSFKLDKVFSGEANNPIYDLDLPNKGTNLVGTIGINSKGRLGWVEPLKTGTDISIDLDSIEAAKSNMLYIRSLVTKDDYDLYLETSSAGAVFEVFNKDRTITITSKEFSDTSIEDNWFFKYRQSYNDSKRSVIFGYTENYKVKMLVKETW